MNEASYLRSLRCFLVLSEALHFGRAAERSHISQSGLSMLIAKLEEAMDGPLFVRERHRVFLTPAGVAFVPHAQRLLAQHQEAQDAIRLAMAGKTGSLRLRLTVASLFTRVVPAVQRHREAHPEVEVQLQELGTVAQQQALLQGDIDVGVLHPPLAHSEISVRKLFDEPLVLVVPESMASRFPRGTSVLPMNELPCVLFPRRFLPHLHDALMSAFVRTQVNLRIVQEAYPMTSAINLAAAGVGVGIVGVSMRCIQRDGVVYRDLPADFPKLEVSLAWNRAFASPVRDQFLLQFPEVGKGGA